MPTRSTLLATNEIYHVFNRSVGKIPIYNSFSSCKRFIELIDFYRFSQPSLRYSHYNRLPLNEKIEYQKKLYQSTKLVDIFTFCLMPNHFHFLIMQLVDNGISKFISNIQNSFAKYYNTKLSRNGSTFQSMFKAKIIEDDNQLNKVQRYIHLNPLNSYLVKNLDELKKYPWSSYPGYLGNNRFNFVNYQRIDKIFKSRLAFYEYIKNQDENKNFKSINHLLIEIFP